MTSTLKTPTCNATRRGFQDLPCPLCGQEGVIRLDLTGVDADGGFHCDECSEDFGVECVRRMIDRWTSVLAFVEQMPVIE